MALAVLLQPMRSKAIDARGIRKRVIVPAHVATVAIKLVTCSGVVSHLLRCSFHANSSTFEATPEDTAIIARGRISTLSLQYLHT